MKRKSSSSIARSTLVCFQGDREGRPYSDSVPGRPQGSPLRYYNFGFAGGDFFAVLVLGPAFDGDGCLAGIGVDGLRPYDATTGECVAQAHHCDVAHFEIGNVGTRSFRDVSDLPGDILSEKGHTQHAVSDHTIKPYATRGLFMQVNGVEITRRFCIAAQLLLRYGGFDQRRKFLTNSSIQNAHNCLRVEIGRRIRTRAGTKGAGARHARTLY